MKSFSLFLSILLLLLLAGEADALNQTFWVSKQGNNSQSCVNSASQPTLSTGSSNTVAGGIGCLTSGDTLYIMPGNYMNESGNALSMSRSYIDKSCNYGTCIPSGIPSRYTRVTLAPGFDRKIIGQQAIIRQGFGMSGQFTYIEISGLVMDGERGTNVTGIYGPSAYCTWVPEEGQNQCKIRDLDEPSYPTFLLYENNEIREMSVQCMYGFGVGSALNALGRPNDPHAYFNPFGNGQSGVVIRNNDVHDCGANDQDHAMYINGNSIVENNQIWHSSGFAIQLQSIGDFKWTTSNITRNNLIWDSAGHIVVECAYCWTYNNVTYQSGDPTFFTWGGQLGVAGGFGIGSYASHNLIANNTVYNQESAIGVYINYEETTSYFNNACINCSGGIFQQGSGFGFNASSVQSNNVTAPTSALVNPVHPNQNFQLTSTASTLINAGCSTNCMGQNIASILGALPNTSSDANNVARPQPPGGQWDVGACEWSSSATKCPNFTSGIGPPPPPPATIAITGPVSGPRYITTVQAQPVSGTASCPSGSAITNVAWKNNQGGNGNATVVGGIWNLTGNLTPDRINVFDITVTCGGPSPPSPPTATASFQVAYSPPELVAAYAFDETSGTAPQDQSGKNNHGTFGAGVAYSTTAKYGARSLSFTGGSVTIPNSTSLDIVGGFTLSAWVSPSQSTVSMRSVITKNYDKFLYGQWGGGAGCADNVPVGGFLDNAGGGNQIICAPLPPISINTFSCIAMTYDGTALTMYVNNTPTAVPKAYEFPLQQNGTLQIGNNQYNEAFAGLIDEVRIYKYARSAAEVQTDCNTQVGTGTVAPPSGLKLGSVGIRIGDADVKVGQ